jgi:hypothetical protein
LRLPNGDDHPEAAHKHLQDAGVLLAQQRPDGAAYLSGYVVECALKSLWLHETGIPPPDKPMPWGRRGHELNHLSAEVANLAANAGSKTARYLGVSTRSVGTSAVAGWTPEMRYRPPSMTDGDAQAWHQCARDVYQETVHQMRLDGVI